MRNELDYYSSRVMQNRTKGWVENAQKYVAWGCKLREKSR